MVVMRCKSQPHAASVEAPKKIKLKLSAPHGSARGCRMLQAQKNPTTVSTFCMKAIGEHINRIALRWSSITKTSIGIPNGATSLTDLRILQHRTGGKESERTVFRGTSQIGCARHQNTLILLTCPHLRTIGFGTLIALPQQHIDGLQRKALMALES